MTPTLLGKLERAIVLFALVSVYGVGAAPAPTYKPPRVPPMAGSWDVQWVDLDVRLDLRPDGSALFTYTKVGGTWDGSWKYDSKARRLTLTLQITEDNSQHYILTFHKLEPDQVEGGVERGNPLPESLKMTRVKRK